MMFGLWNNSRNYCDGYVMLLYFVASSLSRSSNRRHHICT